MIEENIDIQTANGSMNTFVVFPEENGPHPVVFFYMDAPGKREELHDMARRLKFVDTHAMADQSRIGAVGYCMSGPIVMWIAAQFPDRFQSIASIHGANMATDAPDSPHLMPPQIKCESYFACAEIDKWAPPADIQKLESSLLQAKSKFRIEWYPKVEHGFVFPQRAGMYNPQAAERHWERLFDLFGRTLK